MWVSEYCMYLNGSYSLSLLSRFKVYHAIQQAIEQSRDSIILVFRQDIPDYKLNHALCLRRAMFKSRCVLEWPIQKERLNVFYQQLKTALQSSSKVLWNNNNRHKIMNGMDYLLDAKKLNLSRGHWINIHPCLLYSKWKKACIWGKRKRSIYHGHSRMKT